MIETTMRVRTFFSMLLLFTSFLSLIVLSSSQQNTLDATLYARLLDDRLQQCAFQAFSTPKTGILHDAKVPSNLTGIEVSAMKVRTRSLWLKGVGSFKEFEIPKGIIELPYFKKIVLVYQNLGNWSQVFYPLSGYSYLGPVLGLLAYDGTNLSSSKSCELELKSYDKPIMVNFSYVKESSTFGTLAKCVYFDLFGSIRFDNLLNGNVCPMFEQGHVSIVVESTNAPSLVDIYMREVIKLKIVIICLVGGIVLMIVFGLLLICTKLRRDNKKTKINQLEIEDDCIETMMKIAYVGEAKVPMALVTRTKPVLEIDYVP